MIRAALLCVLGAPLHAEGLTVQFQDGDPRDRLIIFNQGCPLNDAEIRVDFSTSTGRLVIDTAYGGGGTRDPAPIELIEGQAVLRPVTDGDQSLTLENVTLPNLGALVVTMDVDDRTATFEGDRVVASGSEIAGTEITFAINATTTRVTLNTFGQATLELPPSAGACALS